MITLRQMTAADREAVLLLDVTKEQSAFVDPISDTLAQSSSLRDNHVVVAEDLVVGFFQIDDTPESQRIAGSLELHEVRIAAAHQGKGFGKQLLASLPPYLRSTYPDWASVCLTVNCRNKRAYHLYLLGGFADTGETFHGGRSGPQHVLRMSL